MCSGRLIFSLSLAFPQFKLLSHISSLWLHSGHSGPVLTLSNTAPLISVPPPLAGGGCECLGYFLLGVAFRHVICGFYLFFLPVKFSSEIRKLPPDPPVQGFPGVWKLPLLRLPSWDRSPSLALLSFFLSFIFCPTSFRRQWAAFLGTWCPQLAIRICFCEVCSAFNCSFNEFVGEKVVSPSYSSAIFAPSSSCILSGSLYMVRDMKLGSNFILLHLDTQYLFIYFWLCWVFIAWVCAFTSCGEHGPL